MASFSIQHAFTRRFLWAGYLIGFALGGFFDGILLHQILQWHHLLSAVDSEPLRDLRVQVLADGLFHALMYLIGAIGLWCLYRARRDFTGEAADRNLLADVLIGFGVWHAIDAVFSHWLTGIHRIRMDTANPLAWDIGWLIVFGLLPLLWGLWLKRSYPSRFDLSDRRRATRHGLALSLAALTVVSGWWAAQPPNGNQGLESVVVVLRPDVGAAQFLSSLGESDAGIVWSDRAGSVWVLTARPGASPYRFYRHGAFYVSGSGMPAGCSGWLKAS